MIIQRIKNKIFRMISLEFNALWDYRIFKKNFSLHKKNESRDQLDLQSWILQDKHRLEKAFSLPSPRLQFGADVIPRLGSNLSLYKKQFGKDIIYFIGLGSLKAYEEFHLNKNSPIPQFYSDAIQELKTDYPELPENISGYYKPERTTTEDMNAFSHFASSRHSCRNFLPQQTINDETLKEIMQLAITAPSVCNRQHWHVHFFSGEKKNKILSYQNGNTGFTDNIPMIAVVTSDLKAFYTADERNQPYTDGGIFAMNLMYAIQATGLESCPLNWCISFRTENQFRKNKFIPQNEAVVVVIAFGKANPEAIYAKSPRLPVENFYSINS